VRSWPAIAARIAASAALAACGPAPSPTQPPSTPCCHVHYDLIWPDDSVPASLDYAMTVAGRVVRGRTDESGRLRVDGVPADDYLLEIGGIHMYVSAFRRSEPARRLMLLDDAPPPPPPP
jgi:hypothetical protein